MEGCALPAFGYSDEPRVLPPPPALLEPTGLADLQGLKLVRSVAVVVDLRGPTGNGAMRLIVCRCDIWWRK